MVPGVNVLFYEVLVQTAQKLIHGFVERLYFQMFSHELLFDVSGSPFATVLIL